MEQVIDTDIRVIGEVSKAKSGADGYAVFPGSRAPRWLLPVDNRNVMLSSLALYQPSLHRAKIMKQMAQSLVGIGLGRLILRSSLNLTISDSEVRKIFKKDTLSYAFFCGTPGCHRKTTVQVMEPDGNILGYLKIGDSGRVKDLLKNEAGILQYLEANQILQDQVPHPLFEGVINGRTVLAVDTVKSRESEYEGRLLPAHLGFLVELMRETSKVKKYRESAFRSALHKRTAAAEHYLDRETATLFKRVLSALDHGLGRLDLPFGVCHRDFTAWNTFFHRNRLFVFDWEYAKTDYPPCIDLLHFILQDGILVRHLDAPDLYSRIDEHKELIQLYCAALFITDAWVELLCLAYLLDISLLYCEREQLLLSEDTKKLIAIWSAFMELIMKKGRRKNEKA